VVVMNVKDVVSELLAGSGSSSVADKEQLFKYSGCDGQAVCLWVRLFRQEERVVVVATDLNGRFNSRPSLSSTLTLAEEICRRSVIPPKQLVLIEHYTRSAQGISRTGDPSPERFQWARLKWDRENKRFSGATWIELSRRTVESILHHTLRGPGIRIGTEL